jgi:hypothetical protein
MPKLRTGVRRRSRFRDVLNDTVAKANKKGTLKCVRRSPRKSGIGIGENLRGFRNSLKPAPWENDRSVGTDHLPCPGPRAVLSLRRVNFSPGARAWSRPLLGCGFSCEQEFLVQTLAPDKERSRLASVTSRPQNEAVWCNPIPAMPAGSAVWADRANPAKAGRRN